MADDFKQRAQAYGRQVRCAGMPFVLWRETEQEARAEVQRIMDQTDMVAAQNWANGLSIGSESMTRL